VRSLLTLLVVTSAKTCRNINMNFHRSVSALFGTNNCTELFIFKWCYRMNWKTAMAPPYLSGEGRGC
jgi:hypothetical protein